METLIKQLHDVAHYARHNPHSDFYRAWYANKSVPDDIHSLADWRSLPPLTKSGISATPFWKRIFTDPSLVDTLRNTSGTTGGEVLVMPRNKLTSYSYFPKHIRVRGMIQGLAAQHLYERQTWMLWPDAYTITTHPAHLEQSVKMAAHLDANTIQTFGFMIDALFPLLKKYRIADRIELIEFMGERLTPGMWKKTKTALPNAEIIVDYGSSELQSVAAVAYPETHPSHACEYVPQRTHLIELLEKESDTAITEPGVEGELTITTLWTENNPFPLLRYRSGDAAKLIKADEHPWHCTYDILGRINLDRIKITGGELRVEEVERTLRVLGLGEAFELHFYGNEATPRVELHVEGVEAPADESSLSERIAKELRISPTFTYQDGIDRGWYAPITVHPLTTKERRTKTVRFFSH